MKELQEYIRELQEIETRLDAIGMELFNHIEPINGPIRCAWSESLTAAACAGKARKELESIASDRF